MNNVADILPGRVVDVYDGDTALASALVTSGAEQVTLYTRGGRNATQDRSIATRPYEQYLKQQTVLLMLCTGCQCHQSVYRYVPKRTNLCVAALAPTGPGSWLTGLFRRLVMGKYVSNVLWL